MATNMNSSENLFFWGGSNKWYIYTPQTKVIVDGRNNNIYKLDERGLPPRGEEGAFVYNPMPEGQETAAIHDLFDRLLAEARLGGFCFIDENLKVNTKPQVWTFTYSDDKTKVHLQTKEKNQKEQAAEPKKEDTLTVPESVAESTARRVSQSDMFRDRFRLSVVTTEQPVQAVSSPVTTESDAVMPPISLPTTATTERSPDQSPMSIESDQLEPFTPPVEHETTQQPEGEPSRVVSVTHLATTPSSFEELDMDFGKSLKMGKIISIWSHYEMDLPHSNTFLGKAKRWAQTSIITRFIPLAISIIPQMLFSIGNVFAQPIATIRIGLRAKEPTREIAWEACKQTGLAFLEVAAKCLLCPYTLFTGEWGLNKLNKYVNGSKGNQNVSKKKKCWLCFCRFLSMSTVARLAEYQKQCKRKVDKEIQQVEESRKRTLKREQSKIALNRK